MSTDTEDDRVDEDERVEEICQWELAIGHEDDDESDDGREDLESPREVVMWYYRWPEEDEEKGDDEGEVVAHVKNYLICSSILSSKTSSFSKK